ncbi:MAG: type II and III secretion system protein family protein [Robiginitomaculum sp.]|nr:type II and III secretion system protein family protein [Robiginitomaculum sp.]
MLRQHVFMLSTAASLAFLCMAQSAFAGPRSYADVRSTAQQSQMASQNTVSKSIIVPYGKSTTIDVPSGMAEVIVSNPDIIGARVHTASRVLLTGKKPGQTNVFFYGHGGQEILNLEIRVERDLTGLNALIRQHAPGNSVEVQAYNNNILLSGAVADAATATRVLDLAKLWLSENTDGDSAGEITNLMTVTGNDMVQLKVRIIEMQRSVTKQMGINFNALGQIGGANIGLISNASVGSSAGFTGNLNWTNSAGGAFRSLSAGLTALERVGLVRTLAEPVLTAVSGETANFLAGGEFPLLTNVFVDQNGQVQREFEYKPFGVSLGFTPTVLSEGRISLNISTEVSEPTTEGAFETSGGANVLGLRVRRANSVVILPAGGSMVIAGLIREESRQSTQGPTGIKDIPGLGSLFRSRDDQTTETELVIIVTPYLVSATHPDKLQTPLDGFVAANDRQSVLLGRLNKVYGKNGNTVPDGIMGKPFGHVVE